MSPLGGGLGAFAALFRRLRPFGLNAGQQGFGAVITADQVGVGGAPVGSQLAAKGLGQNGLGQVIDPRFGRLGLLLYGIGIGK